MARFYISLFMLVGLTMVTQARRSSYNSDPTEIEDSPSGQGSGNVDYPDIGSGNDQDDFGYGSPRKNGRSGRRRSRRTPIARKYRSRVGRYARKFIRPSKGKDAANLDMGLDSKEFNYDTGINGGFNINGPSGAGMAADFKPKGKIVTPKMGLNFRGGKKGMSLNTDMDYERALKNNPLSGVRFSKPLPNSIY